MLREHLIESTHISILESSAPLISRLRAKALLEEKFPFFLLLPKVLIQKAKPDQSEEELYVFELLLNFFSLFCQKALNFSL